jgi:hypothetical protein
MIKPRRRWADVAGIEEKKFDNVLLGKPEIQNY